MAKEKFKKVPGMDLLVNFGGFGDDVAKSVLCLYGDQNSDAAGWAMMAADSEFPEDACLAPHQKVSMYFETAEYLPYCEVVKLADKVIIHLESKGWASAQEVESSFGPSANTIENMVNAEDLGAHKVLGPGCYEKYPDTGNGRWAAKGFLVKFERVDNGPEFTNDEVAEVVQLHAEAMELVFGEKLEEITL